MRTAGWLMCVAVAGLLAGCASVKMNVDSGPIAARTFSFPALGPGSGNPLRANEQKAHTLIQEAIIRHLAAKGVTRVETGGDIVVAYLIIVGDGAATTYRDEYFGFYSDAPELMGKVHDRSLKTQGRDYMVAGTLVVDILDGKTSQMLMRKTVESEILRDVSEDVREARVQAVVDQALGSLKIVP